MRYNINELTDNNGKAVLKVFYSSVPSGERAYREHHHTECEISTIMSGSGIYTVKNKTYCFNAGDVFLFGSDEPHCITKISENFVLLNIQFAPGFLWSDPDAFSALQIFFSRNENFENKIDADNPKTLEIHNEMLSIDSELSKKQDGYQLISKYLLYKILITLIRSYGYIGESTNFSWTKNTVSQMKAALSFIDKNLDSPITLRDIAGSASMAPTYFSAIFKKMNGISPWEYMTIKRVEKAIELLKSSNLTKLEIAMQCGFSSSSNFYRAFSKVTGKKPSDFK